MNKITFQNKRKLKYKMRKKKKKIQKKPSHSDAFELFFNKC